MKDPDYFRTTLIELHIGEEAYGVAAGKLASIARDKEDFDRISNVYIDMLIIHADWISTYHAMGLLREVSDIYDMAGITQGNYAQV